MPRIANLATTYSKVYAKENSSQPRRCSLQTLMKGCFSLLTCKHPKSALKISKCNILIYQEIFKRATQAINISGKKGAKDDEMKVMEVLQN